MRSLAGKNFAQSAVCALMLPGCNDFGVFDVAQKNFSTFTFWTSALPP
jgi:hypothetical protein